MSSTYTQTKPKRYLNVYTEGVVMSQGQPRMVCGSTLSQGEAQIEKSNHLALILYAMHSWHTYKHMKGISSTIQA